jgi:hypothetical protein
MQQHGSDGGGAAPSRREKSQQHSRGTQSRAPRGARAADRDKVPPRKAAFDLIRRGRSAQLENAPYGGQTIGRAGTRIDANPIYCPGILPELLREDFRDASEASWSRARSRRSVAAAGATSHSPENETPAASATATKERRSPGFSDTASMITEYPAASASAALRRSVR